MIHRIIKNTQYLLVATLISIPATGEENDPLDRRAAWQARFTANSDGAPGRIIQSIEENSPLQKAGMVAGDTLLAIDGQAITDGPTWYDLTDALVSGHNYELTYRSGGQIRKATAAFPAVPLETYETLDVSYDSITSDYNIRQRVIITRPKGLSEPSPAIFVLQGLSCSSIEQTPGRQSNFMKSLTNLARESGMVMMRTEKSGLGDSEGNCSRTDFQTELNGYEVALKKLQSLPYVDPDRIIVYGNSMGSALAPYFANKFKLNGVIADGTWYRTWFEHMLEIERRIKQMQGMDEKQINDLINRAYIPLYYGMLIEKKSYADVIKEKPFLKEHNYHGGSHMYGRPVQFYHQLQDFDIAGNWAALQVPVRIRWGTNDWIMSEYDNDILIEVLKAAGNNNAQLYKHPGLDHWSTIHETATNSFQGKPGKWEDKISQQIIDWAIELNSQANQLP